MSDFENQIGPTNTHNTSSLFCLNQANKIPVVYSTENKTQLISFLTIWMFQYLTDTLTHRRILLSLLNRIHLHKAILRQAILLGLIQPIHHLCTPRQTTTRGDDNTPSRWMTRTQSQLYALITLNNDGW